MKLFNARKRFYLTPIVILLCAYITAALSSNIRVTYVYKVLPAFIIYTNHTCLDTSRVAGCRGPLIIINNDYRGCKEVLAHEKIHMCQVYRTFFLHWIPCLISKDFLAKAEAEAYGKINMLRKEDAPIYAKMIREEYSPDTDVNRIEKQLVYYWKTRHNKK